MITGRDILYISSIEWDFLWQAHQEIARRLAAAGNRVLYIENTGVRSPGLKDTKRVVSRLGRSLHSLRRRGAREVAPNIFVYSPLVLPPFGSRWQRSLNRHFFLRHLRGITRGLGMKDILIWTYLPTDTALDIIRTHESDGSLLIYYAVADFSYLTSKTAQLERSERELLRLTDLLFVNCSKLAGKFVKSNPNPHVFPPGVDMSAFPLDTSTEPADRPDPLGLARLPRPIIGYVGGMHRFVDYDLVAAMARARSDWSWVFLGAHQVSLEKLQGLPNVHLLGQQPHEELAWHMRFFDVCIVPYLETNETSTVVPTKINEYLAAGKAIVATSLPTVCEFNEQHHILTTAAATAQEFLQAIESELPMAHDARLQEKRREVAALADWQNRLEVMSRFIEGTLSRSPNALRRSTDGKDLLI
jgi:glycosyltransferase involved in cell wall biosynthesis